jgi:hypothetical protein
VDERIPIGLIGHNRRVLLIQGLSVRGRPVLEALGGPALHAADLPSEASLSARLSKAAHARYLPLSWNGIYRQSQRSVNKWSNNYAGERCNDHRHEYRVDGVHRCPPIGCGQGGAGLVYSLEGVGELNLSSSVPAAVMHACVDSFSAHLMKIEISPRLMWKMAAGG